MVPIASSLLRPPITGLLPSWCQSLHTHSNYHPATGAILLEDGTTIPVNDYTTIPLMIVLTYLQSQQNDCTHYLRPPYRWCNRIPCFLYHKPFYCGLCLTNLSKSSNPLTAKIILLLLLFSLLIHRSPFVTAQEPREPLTCAEHVHEGYTLRLTRAVITTVFDIPHL